MEIRHIISQYSRARGIEDSTITQYHRVTRRFGAHLGRPATVDDLTTDQVNALLWELREHAPHYRRTVRNCLAELLRPEAAAG